MITDLQQLIERYRKEITQLETQVEKVKHKHDILVKASRLLEEETDPSQNFIRKALKRESRQR